MTSSQETEQVYSYNLGAHTGQHIHKISLDNPSDIFDQIRHSHSNA